MPTPRFRMVEIDFDVHKLIESERQSFDEAPNDVLRRLLNLGQAQPSAEASSALATDLAQQQGWHGKGVFLPDGTKVRMTYNNQWHFGEIRGGRWTVDGETHRSPSAAAGAVARTRKGTKPSLDGWLYWEVQRKDDTSWVSLKALRDMKSERSHGDVEKFLKDLGIAP